MSVLNLEIDSVLQKQAEETFSKIGLPVSEAVNIFLRVAVRYGGFPFEDNLVCYNEETQKAIEELQDEEEFEGPFDTVEEVMGALDAPD